ncbi:MAG: sensor domain-containing diguanylate cyclase [Thermodesulfobacteriota bacterium]
MKLKRLHPENLSFVFKIFIYFFIVGIVPLIIHTVFILNDFKDLEKSVVQEIQNYESGNKKENSDKKNLNTPSGRTEFAKKIIDEQLGKYKTYLIWLFIASFSVYVFLSLRIVKMIVKPAKEMKKVLEAVKQGDYSRRVRVDSGDELGELGKSFNEMTEALINSRRKNNKSLEREKKANLKLKEAVRKRVLAENNLLENQKDLERKVNERTKALRKANQSLVSTVRELNSRRRDLSVLTGMYDDLYKCKNKEDTYKIVGKACSLLFPDFSGAVLSYDETKGFLKPVYQWNSGGVLHGAVPVKDCPAMIYRACVRSFTSSTESDCAHISRHTSRQFYCSPVFSMEENVGVISLNHNTEEEHISESKWREMQMVLSTVTDYFKAAYINLSLKNRLKNESVKDRLTGLYNRRYMDSALTNEISRAKRYSSSLGILMFDVDYFKKFNDSYGHNAGDRILKAIGKWFLRNTRKEDIVCRYGGEEFVVMLPGITLQDLVKKGKLIKDGISSEVNIAYEKQVLSVTVSIGACCLSGSTLDESVITKADEALYRAKNKGRNRIEFYSS